MRKRCGPHTKMGGLISSKHGGSAYCLYAEVTYKLELFDKLNYFFHFEYLQEFSIPLSHLYYFEKRNFQLFPILILHLLTIRILPIFVRKDTHNSVTSDWILAHDFLSPPLLRARVVLLRAIFLEEAEATAILGYVKPLIPSIF